jgi:hypothetical protein
MGGEVYVFRLFFQSDRISILVEYLKQSLVECQ